MKHGKLIKNKNGRFEFDGREIFSGDIVQILIGHIWVSGRFHYGRVNSEDEYYFIHDSGALIPLYGKARELPKGIKK